MKHSPHHLNIALEKVFGPHHSFYYLNKLPDISALKRAFRKKSLQLHPDRAKFVGKSSNLLSEEFKALNHAYQALIPYIKKKQSVMFHSPACHYQNHTHRHKEHLPKFKLRFAHFLYYKGIINWRTIVQALVWQMRQRPKVGKIALKDKYLSYDKLLNILKNMKLGEKFLETGLRLGYIDEEQYQAILKKQKVYNYPIGKYFIEKRFLSRTKLHSLLHEFRKHNLQHTR